MPPQTRTYRIDGDLDATAIAAALGARLALSSTLAWGPPRVERRQFLDSFDWRLYRAGAALEWFDTTESDDADDDASRDDGSTVLAGWRWYQLADDDDVPPLCQAVPGSRPVATTPDRVTDPIDDATAPAGIPAVVAAAAIGTAATLRPVDTAALAFNPLAVDLAQMPAGSLRDRLTPVLGVRRLLPVITVETTVHAVELVDDEGGPLLRAEIEDHRLLGPRRPGSLPPARRLRLHADPGHGDATPGLPEPLDDPRFVPLAQAVPHEALSAAARTPGAYNTKLDPALAPRMEAGIAVRTILLGLLDVLSANIDGARANLDPEFLHDLRVATRRTRSALGQVKGVLPAAVLADFKDRFAWLQQVTGPVRDLDVYLLGFPGLQQRIAPELRADLIPLRDELADRHRQAQQTLASALASRRFQALIIDWRDFLTSDSAPNAAGSVPAPDPDSVPATGPTAAAAARKQAPDDPPAAAGKDEAAPSADVPRNAARPIAEVADARIRSLYRRVRREGRAIDAHSPDEALHELRKSTKKLRYLMEFFQSLYPRAEIRSLIQETKRLLDNLGALQDLAVQTQFLRDTAVRMHAAGAPVPTLLAMGALIGAMLDARDAARAEFEHLFADFDARQTRKRFHDLTAGGQRAARQRSG